MREVAVSKAVGEILMQGIRGEKMTNDEYTLMESERLFIARRDFSIALSLGHSAFFKKGDVIHVSPEAFMDFRIMAEVPIK